MNLLIIYVLAVVITSRNPTRDIRGNLLNPADSLKRVVSVLRYDPARGCSFKSLTTTKPGGFAGDSIKFIPAFAESCQRFIIVSVMRKTHHVLDRNGDEFTPPARAIPPDSVTYAWVQGRQRTKVVEP